MHFPKTNNIQNELYNHLPCGCMTVDIDGYVVKVNDTFLSYTGYERAQITQSYNIDHFLSPSAISHIDLHVKPQLNLHGKTENITLELITNEGNTIPCSISSLVGKDDEDNPQFYHYTFIDIRERITYKNSLLQEKERADKTELKLKKVSAELQHITGSITQEIQHPLQNIIGLISLLKKNYSNTTNLNALQFLEFMGGSGEKMRQHLTNILKYSTSGKWVINKVYVDLNVVLDDVLLRLDSIINKYNAEIRLPNTLPTIFGIPEDMNLLFYNLIKNSIQFKKESTYPVIIIKYEEDEKFYNFTIEDNGAGIEKKFHQRIFEEYFHLDPQADDCAGLGLTESRDIVENHRGSISVVSTPNNGCTFYFNLEK